MGQVVVRRPGSDLRYMFVSGVIPNENLTDLFNIWTKKSYSTRMMMHIAVWIRKNLCVLTDDDCEVLKIAVTWTASTFYHLRATL
jgi:hypothetical protein